MQASLLFLSAYSYLCPMLREAIEIIPRCMRRRGARGCRRHDIRAGAAQLRRVGRDRAGARADSRRRQPSVARNAPRPGIYALGIRLLCVVYNRRMRGRNSRGRDKVSGQHPALPHREPIYIRSVPPAVEKPFHQVSRPRAAIRQVVQFGRTRQKHQLRLSGSRHGHTQTALDDRLRAYACRAHVRRRRTLLARSRTVGRSGIPAVGMALPECGTQSSGTLRRRGERCTATQGAHRRRSSQRLCRHGGGQRIPADDAPLRERDEDDKRDARKEYHPCRCFRRRLPNWASSSACRP